jgi:hypothetical protein
MTPDNKTRLDPWTFGELHPSGMSHVTQPRAQPAGLAHPPRPARATRQASLPTAPYLSGGTCWLQANVGLAVAVFAITALRLAGGHQRGPP